MTYDPRQTVRLGKEATSVTPRGATRLALVALSAALMTAACSSGTTGEPTANSGSASVADSPAFPSESVPPGVQKDSVLDLNSTKDMTGVVTTVPINKSPYIDHFPDICALIPNSTMQKLGVVNKKLGFRGTQLISQACVMQNINAGHVDYSVTANFYANNIQEISGPDKAIVQQSGIAVSKNISGITSKLPPTEPNDVTFKEECATSWGTFFGAIVISFRTSTPESVDPCARSIAAAQTLAPLMPTSPSQMRPSS